MSSKGVRHLTTEQKTRVRELHQSGMKTGEIAADACCSMAQVRHALKTAGMKSVGGRPSICDQHADKIRAWANEGLSFSEMARRIGCSHSDVRRFLDRRRFDRTPFHQSGKNNPAWKGGRMIDKTGYVLILMPDHPEANRHGYIREHRLVMERMIGRLLLPAEVVHHKDDDRQNNSPDNLELFATNAEHLAATLKGRRPAWTEEGWAAMRAPRPRCPHGQHESTRPASE
jgi:hypothetical protein